MTLDPRLVRDTSPLLDTTHAHVLLARDTRWPWIILVPRDTRATELHDLADDARRGFLDAVTATGEALQRASGCESVNVAMLGNVVAQLHGHVVARSPGDPNWPGPIWGFGSAELRAEDAAEPGFATSVRRALRALDER